MENEEIAALIEAEMEETLTEVEEKKLDDFLVNLFFRWKNEREFEDFSEYKKVIRAKFDFLTIYKITQRPFGLKFRVVNNLNFHLYIKVEKKTCKIVLKKIN